MDYLPPGQTMSSRSMKLLVCLAAHAALVTAQFDDCTNVDCTDPSAPPECCEHMNNPCADQGVACAGDTDCMQLTMSQYMMGNMMGNMTGNMSSPALDMYEPTMYDMAECGTNNLCAAMI